MTETIFFKIYRRKFLIAYSDFVALAQIKPQQILVEESNILSHLAQYNNLNLSQQVRDENLTKASMHLYRATLDLQKLIWVRLDELLKMCIELNPKYIVCFNMPEGEVLQRYTHFKFKAKEARRKEMFEVGVSPLRSIVRYDRANKIGFELWESFDSQKHAKMDGWLKAYKTKEAGISFAMGVASGVVGNAIFAMINLPEKTKTFTASATLCISNLLKGLWRG